MYPWRRHAGEPIAVPFYNTLQCRSSGAWLCAATRSETHRSAPRCNLCVPIYFLLSKVSVILLCYHSDPSSPGSSLRLSSLSVGLVASSLVIWSGSCDPSGLLVDIELLCVFLVVMPRCTAVLWSRMYLCTRRSCSSSEGLAPHCPGWRTRYASTAALFGGDPSVVLCSGAARCSDICVHIAGCTHSWTFI